MTSSPGYSADLSGFYHRTVKSVYVGFCTVVVLVGGGGRVRVRSRRIYGEFATIKMEHHAGQNMNKLIVVTQIRAAARKALTAADPSYYSWPDAQQEQFRATMDELAQNRDGVRG